MVEFYGFGQVGFGRFQVGQATSDVEPRFSSSKPSDGSMGVSIFQYTISFSVYCFSSRVQWGAGSGLLVEVSEDGGSVYSSAYEDGVFVSPFNGANSRIDGQNADPQLFTVYIHKTSNWSDSKEIKIRVTGYDEYGNEATKETPVEW